MLNHSKEIFKYIFFIFHTIFQCRECSFILTDKGYQSCRINYTKPRLWFFTGGYLVKRWFIPAAATARGQSNDLNREILASNLFNCHKEVINAPPVPSISRCIHIVYRNKNVWEYQWPNFIYNCMSTFLHYVHCKDALLDCSAPGGERCESLTWVDEIVFSCHTCKTNCQWNSTSFHDTHPATDIFTWIYI